MNENIIKIKDEFYKYLYEISKMKMVAYITTFVQGEDAFLLRLLMNGKMSPKELSDELKITKGRVTALISKLIDKNYILKLDNPDDKRGFYIDLTDEGGLYLNDKLSVADNYFNKVFKAIGEEDSKALVHQMEILFNKVKEANI